AVMEPRETVGVVIDPARDASQRVLARDAAKERFIMVGDAKEEVYRFVASRQASIWPASQVRRKPAVQVVLPHLPDPQGDQPNDGQDYNQDHRIQSRQAGAIGRRRIEGGFAPSVVGAARDPHSY